jgi:hypothetical protein
MSRPVLALNKKRQTLYCSVSKNIKDKLNRIAENEEKSSSAAVASRLLTKLLKDEKSDDINYILSKM